MSTEMNNQQPQVEPINPMPEYPMKWYKFLINFLLFASAVLNLINGFRYLTGAIYGDVNPELVYAFFDGLKPLDMVVGVACIALAIFAIYTRMRLANFKKDAPKCVYALYIAGAAISLIYVLIAQAVIGVDGGIPAETIGSIVGSGVMVICNYTYFQKRQSLFVND